MLLFIILSSVLVFASGVYLLREKMRGTSSTSYIILSVTSALTLANLLFAGYAYHANLVPPSPIHDFVLSQQLFSVFGFGLIHWRLYQTFKRGYCSEAYACPMVRDHESAEPVGGYNGKVEEEQGVVLAKRADSGRQPVKPA